MATIGRITATEIAASGAFPFRTTIRRHGPTAAPVITHGFRGRRGTAVLRWQPAEAICIHPAHAHQGAARVPGLVLAGAQGAVGAFSYDVPQEDGSLVTKDGPFRERRSQAGGVSPAYLLVRPDLRRDPDPRPRPVYSVAATVTRSPIPRWGRPLLQEVQEIIFLVRYRVPWAAVTDIYLSDRLVTVGGQVYLSRGCCALASRRDCAWWNRRSDGSERASSLRSATRPA